MGVQKGQALQLPVQHDPAACFLRMDGQTDSFAMHKTDTELLLHRIRGQGGGGSLTGLFLWLSSSPALLCL